MHPKHVGPIDNNLQYTKFPNAAHFLDMVVLWDPPFIIYNKNKKMGKLGQAHKSQ